MSGDANTAEKLKPTEPRRVRRSVEILRDDVANQIAAGEVVERPASVVKELVENSVDAGATEITVIADNGGISNIEIIDDGCGMSRRDALIAVQRFGTSKIREAADLESISSLGFRGEALPSIASVSRFRLRTRSRESTEPGTEIVIDGAAATEAGSCDVPPGTRVQVRQLFFNVPARRKFLRAEKTEALQIKHVITDFSLIYPQIRFRLVLDGVEAAVFHPAGDFYGRAALLRIGAPEPFSIDYVHTSQASPVPIRIVAVLSKPIAAAPTSDRLRLFVNGRLVRDKLLLRAVRDGYGNFLKPGTYPAGALILSTADSEVDVNVHPQKSEVRFRSPQSVFGAVSGAIRSALREQLPEENRLALKSSPAFGYPQTGPTAPSEAGQTALFSGSGFLNASAGPDEARVAPADGARQLLDPGQYRYVGQLFELYLILEGPEGMLLVDMHAAHERVMYVRIKERLLNGVLPSQLLLTPEIVKLEPGNAERLGRCRAGLLELGIDLEPFGESAVAVRSVPALLRNPSPAKLIEDLAAVAEWGVLDNQLAGPRQEVILRLESAIARLACHRSIRSGRQLEREEVYALLYELNRVEGSAFCPHGRPVLRFISPYEFERIFGR